MKPTSTIEWQQKKMTRANVPKAPGEPPEETRAAREKRKSEEGIYRYVMKGGGAAFGQPYESGKQSLTEKIVKFFKQRGFFGFETLETPKTQTKTNKFTKYGAARYRGPYKKPQD